MRGSPRHDLRSIERNALTEQYPHYKLVPGTKGKRNQFLSLDALLSRLAQYYI